MISISFKSIKESLANNSTECFCYIVPLFDLYSNSKLNDINYPYFLTKNDIETIVNKKKFTGKEKEIIFNSHILTNEIKYSIFCGLGKEDSSNSGNLKESLRNIIGSIIRFIEKNKISSINIALLGLEFIDKKTLSEIISSTILISSYEFNLFITDKNKHAFREYYCNISFDDLFKEDCLIGIDNGIIISNAVNQCRLWGDMPPSDLYPKVFAEQAENLIKENSNIKIDILKKSDLEFLGMGGILGVCRGSMHDPYLFIAEYIPDSGKYEKTIALVGKGVTFDTGGISIKPSDNMEDMKDDMAGAATVLSSIDALSKLKSPHRIIAVAPMVENMPSGSAFKPGDIITFYNKKTAEIKNTDAEGRLILADALSYVSENYKPDLMIDLATLTGACSIALGPVFAAVMSKQENIVNSIKAAGIQSGDRCWELPLDDLYKNAVESDVADLCNIGKSRYRAGTITAGWFLKHFVPDNIEWAHIDIASMSMHSVGKTYLRNVGTTGFGVRLCIELLSTNKYL